MKQIKKYIILGCKVNYPILVNRKLFINFLTFLLIAVI